MCSLPDADTFGEQSYQGAWLTQNELRQRNRGLAALGRRICRVHQGIALPLTEEYFYHSGYKDYFRHECRKCQDAANMARARARYRWDRDFFEKCKAYRQKSYTKHIGKRRIADRRRKARMRVKRKRAAFAAVLGVSL